MANDENYRLKYLQKELGQKLYGASGRALAYDLLDTWELVARDLLLIENYQNDLISHLDLDEEITKVVDKVSSLEIIKAIKRARKYLAANLNPRAVLEEFVLSF